MPRGPAPSPNSRRRNVPTINPAELPADGRPGRAPAVPDSYKPLGKAGKAWWAWAWKLPQATQWDDGSLYVVARRAALEDDLATLDDADGLDLKDLVADAGVAITGEDVKKLRSIGAGLEFVIGRLKGLAGSRISVMKEMRELDNRLGLNPKAMLDMRWKIAGKPEPKSKPSAKKKAKKKAPAKVANLDDYRDRLG